MVCLNLCCPYKIPIYIKILKNSDYAQVKDNLYSSKWFGLSLV